jgi:hypothetical protein
LAEAKDVAHSFRIIMPLKGSKQYASRAHHTLRFYHRILTETEIAMHDQEAGRSPTWECCGKKRSRRIRFKPFTMLPIKAGYTISYVSISSATFINILKKLKKVDGTVPGHGLGLDHEAKRNIWARVCNVKAVETRSRAFNCSIVTDGCAVSILVTKRSSICPINPQISAGFVGAQSISELFSEKHVRRRQQSKLKIRFLTGNSAEIRLGVNCTSESMNKTDRNRCEVR